MRNRTLLLIATVLVLGLLSVGSTVDTMALTHCGFVGIGYGNGMMGGQQYRGNTMEGISKVLLSGELRLPTLPT